MTSLSAVDALTIVNALNLLVLRCGELAPAERQLVRDAVDAAERGGARPQVLTPARLRVMGAYPEVQAAVCLEGGGRSA